MGLLSRRKRARWGSGQGLLQKAGEGIAEGLLAWGWKEPVRFESWDLEKVTLRDSAS